MSRRTKARSIKGSFVLHLMEMRESPAWRALPDHARRVLDRLEIEHMRQGGAENGRLVCTYADFARAGIPEKAITLAIRQCEALGFIQVTQRGNRSAAQFRAPSLYGLTYVPERGKGRDECPDLWRHVADDEGAHSALRLALSKGTARAQG